MQANGSAVGGTRHRRIVLHFDINNTILMKDGARGINNVQFNVSLFLFLQKYIGCKNHLEISLGKSNSSSGK
jgi:hypothetical protein